jgi:methylated-DNA-protein-cysteine methyltransferase-like protein
MKELRRGASLYQRIYRVIRRIPKGRVSTYGTVAALLGCGARQVGYAMAALPNGSHVPWHRVVNARGGVSIPGATGVTQRLRLEAEGVRFSQRGVVDLKGRGWPRPIGRKVKERARRGDHGLR